MLLLHGYIATHDVNYKLVMCTNLMACINMSKYSALLCMYKHTA